MFPYQDGKATSQEKVLPFKLIKILEVSASSASLRALRFADDRSQYSRNTASRSIHNPVP
jgi:hypothetical protein